jgi:hypothetical protein
MERDRNSSSVSSILSVGKEDTFATKSPDCFQVNWPKEKAGLIANFALAGLNNKAVSNAVKSFKDALEKYPDSTEVRAEKAKYGLGPPEFLQSETADNPRDIKSALWVCMLRGHCHKHKQTKVLLRVTSDEHFEKLKKINLIRPENKDVPLFLCAYHFVATNETSGKQISSVFIRHWFQNQTLPENIELCTSVRSEAKRNRRSATVSEALWDLLQQGVTLDDSAICKMKGANAP